MWPCLAPALVARVQVRRGGAKGEVGCCYGEGWMLLEGWVEEWWSRSGWAGGWSHSFEGPRAGTRVTVVGEVTGEKGTAGGR